MIALKMVRLQLNLMRVIEIALLIVKQLRTHQIAGILNDKISCDEEFYTF